MMDEILTMAVELCGRDKPSAILEGLCIASERFLHNRLRESIMPEDCGKAYPLAVAALAAKAFFEGMTPGTMEHFSAGDLSIDVDKDGDRFVAATMNLMEPYLKDERFSFLGV